MKRFLPIFTVAATAAAVSGCSAADTGIDAASLLETRCSVCHSTVIPKNARKSKSEWESTVTRMIQKGAALSLAEKKALVRYLAKHYRL
jgi:cytochrome c5